MPCAIRWPGVLKPGVSNAFFSHTDMLPTLLAAAGEPDVVEKLKQGYNAVGHRFRVHVDGCNLLPHLTGQEAESPRKAFFYWSDDGDLMAVRYDRWKIHFMAQRSHGMDVWREPLSELRVPELVDLRSDPFERGPEDASLFYDRWVAARAYVMVPAQALVGAFLETFAEYPPRQKPASFSVDRMLEKAHEREEALAAGAGGAAK